MASVKVAVLDVPLDTQTEIWRSLQNYTIGIGYAFKLMGTGTLVSFDGRTFVATAQHVVDAIPDSTEPNDEIYFLISNDPHKFSIPRSALIIHGIGKPGDVGGEGPDLALIELTGLPQLGTITAKKSAFPLERSIEHLTNLEGDHGLWAVFGFVNEITEHDESGYLGEPTQEIIGVTFFGPKPELSTPVEGFDVATFFPEYTYREGLPEYGGVSGGGFWWINMGIDDSVSPPVYNSFEIIFSGVVFWQTGAREDTGTRDFIANGPRSICHAIPDRLRG